MVLLTDRSGLIPLAVELMVLKAVRLTTRPFLSRRQAFLNALAAFALLQMRAFVLAPATMARLVVSGVVLVAEVVVAAETLLPTKAQVAVLAQMPTRAPRLVRMESEMLPEAPLERTVLELTHRARLLVRPTVVPLLSAVAPLKIRALLLTETRLFVETMLLVVAPLATMSPPLTVTPLLVARAEPFPMAAPLFSAMSFLTAFSPLASVMAP